MSEDKKVNRVTLFVPGPASLERTKLDGVEVEWVVNDGEFGAAFSYGTVVPALVKQIEKAAGALVLKFTVDLRDGRDQILKTVKRLGDSGALAVRLEQSKLGWAIDQWLTVFLKKDLVAWHRTAVVFLGGKGYLQSCGMHAFSLPDVRIGVTNNGPAMQRLATVLNLYQLDADPVIRSGQTFAPDAQTPRRLMERWPDTGYPPGHPCHNPYGVWHVGPPGGKARPLGELQPTHMPPLLALLSAAEEKGKKLTQRQVEKIRDDGVCIAMTPEDVQKLERSRGFADLDAELVWEQWKAFRDLLKS